MRPMLARGRRIGGPRSVPAEGTGRDDGLKVGEDEIADFLAEAGQQVGGIEKIRAFVAAARRKALDEDVVCLPEVIGEGLELSLCTPGR